jgi:hypothetical protein
MAGSRVVFLETTMQKPFTYKEVFALAEQLPPEHLVKLICALSKFLHERYGKWTELKDLEEVREYLEWMRFRDSYHPEGKRKSPEEFLLELHEDE